MNRFVSLSVLALGVIALPACERIFGKRAAEPAVQIEPAAVEPVAPALEERPAVTVSTVAVDWEAARRDFAAQPPASEDVQVAGAGDPPPVPLLLPGGDTVSAASGAVTYRSLSDGYFANIPGPAYNIVISGTNQVASGGAAAAGTREGTYRFETTSTGAMVAFTKYNVDYLVEYECNEVSTEGTCITEADALRIAREMVPAGVR